MPTNANAAGGALRVSREAAGITIEQLAARSGVSATSLSRFETGQRNLSPSAYAHTMTALGHLLHNRTEDAA